MMLLLLLGTRSGAYKSFGYGATTTTATTDCDSRSAEKGSGCGTEHDVARVEGGREREERKTGEGREEGEKREKGMTKKELEAKEQQQRDTYKSNQIKGLGQCLEAKERGRTENLQSTNPTDENDRPDRTIRGLC